MRKCNKLFGLAASCLTLISGMTAGNANAGTEDFTANFNTTEFLLPAPSCPSQQGGIGVGTGTTNLFTKKPETQKTTAVLSSFDCVNPKADGTLGFGPGTFTLTGPGGESIFATYTGTLTPTATDPVTKLPVYSFSSATFNITGGTGRYLRAGGGGTISGTETINFATGTAQGSLAATGKIVY